MLGKLRNYGFMRYKTELLPRMTSIHLHGPASSNKTVDGSTRLVVEEIDEPFDDRLIRVVQGVANSLSASA